MAKKERKSDTRDWVSYGAFGLVMMLLTYLLVARTPLRRTIPGYPSPETQRAAIENYRRIDSLEKVIDLWAFQVTNIQRVATGREPLPLDSLGLARTETEPDEAEMADYRTSDSLLRAQVEILDAEQQSRPESAKIAALEGIKFTRPLKGQIKEAFSRTGSHPYVDVTAPAGTGVAAVLDGRIVSAEWSSLEGCTVRMQHDDDLTVIFRHGGKLLRNVGEQVKAGTPVVTTGQPGELSDAHILIELRYKNQPVDPALYISF